MSDLDDDIPSCDSSDFVKVLSFDGLRRSLLPDRENAFAVVELIARLGGCGTNGDLASWCIRNVPEGAVCALRLNFGLSVTGLMVATLL